MPGLDQLPEVLRPLLVLKGPLELSFMAVIVVSVVFTVLDLALTPLRHGPEAGKDT